jgi:hypothetical protein
LSRIGFIVDTAHRLAQLTMAQRHRAVSKSVIEKRHFVSAGVL